MWWWVLGGLVLVGLAALLLGLLARNLWHRLHTLTRELAAMLRSFEEASAVVGTTGEDPGTVADRRYHQGRTATTQQ